MNALSPDGQDRQFMARALELARRGQGHVEPNPMVGCVVVAAGQIVGEGWHPRFGDAHAEVVALHAAGQQARGATLFVTLEPCCHHGKTPPCTAAILQAGIGRVVAATRDPQPLVAGKGCQQLEHQGVSCNLGLLETEAQELLAPYRKLTTRGRPWVLAKWAMTLDGKIATATGDSQWISNPTSRAVAHLLRGRVDAIVVGSATAVRDDPLLTARCEGDQQAARQATRIVCDSTARLPLDSQLVTTAGDVPTLVATSASAPDENCQPLTDRGVEVVRLPGATHGDRSSALLDELGRRAMTNILVEGGGRLLGSFRDLGEIDELHVFLAPLLAGGAEAITPLAGQGVARIADALVLASLQAEDLAGDLYLQGRLDRSGR